MSQSNSTLRCPSCDKSFLVDLNSQCMPFCSQRCKLADLHHWMTESIGIPSGSSEEEDEGEPEPPPAPKEWKFD
jgi:uncharacterized protein